MINLVSNLIKEKRILILFIILGVQALVLTKLIFFPYPELFVYPYLTNNGLLPYKQVFDQHFPGLMFLPINLNNLGMVNEITARWWLIGVVLATQLLIFFITLKIFKSYKKALLASFLYLLWQPFLEGWVLWIDTFLPLFLLPAFYFTYLFINKSISKKVNFKFIFLAGLFLGLGVLFKQVVLPLTGFVLLISLFYVRNVKSILFFLLGFLPIPLLAALYYWRIGALENLWFWTIVFNLTTFAQYGRKPPFLSGIIRVGGIYSPLLLAPLLKDKKLIILFVVFIGASLSGDIARFDFVHFQPSLPFVVILTSVVLFKLWEKGKTKILLLLYFAVALIWLSVFYKGHLSNRVMFFDDQTKLISNKIKSYAKPKEEIFLFGPVTHLYQMSETLPVGKIFVFQFPWFLMETEDKFLDALKNNKPNLIVRDRTVAIEGQSITVFAKKLDNYILENYEVFDRVQDTEFLKRKDK